MKIKETEELWGRVMPVLGPEFRKRIWPRRIVCPNGYIDPKYFALSSVSHAMKKDLECYDEVIHSKVSCAITAFNNLGCPTYFVDKEFIFAVDATKPPPNKLCDLKYPLKSMMFVLPNTFWQTRIKWRIPYLTYSFLNKGPFDPDPDICNSRFELNSDCVILQYPFIRSDGDIIEYMWWSGTDIPPEEYNNHIEMHDDAEVLKAYLHATGRDDVADLVSVRELEPTKEEEVELSHVMVNLFFKIMAVLSARPHYLYEGGIGRPQRIKNGAVVKEELWSPNYIGKGYQIRRAYDPQGGHHASPKTHWRIGHWHTIKFGKGRQQERQDWFEPVLVNAK